MTSSTIQDAINQTDDQFNDDPQEVLKNNLNNQINYTGHAAGLTTEVATGLALDAKTAKLLTLGPWGWLAYAAINAGGGGTANIAAQKMRGEEDTDWGEVASAALLGIIPFTSLRLSKKGTKLLGEAYTVRRAATGGAGMGVADRFIQSGVNEGELPSPSDVALGAVAGGSIGALLQGGFKSIENIRIKYANQDPKVIAQKLTKRERSNLTAAQKNILEAQRIANETGSEEAKAAVNEAVNLYRRAQWNWEKSQGMHGDFKTYEDFKKAGRYINLNLNRQINDLPFLPAKGPKTDTGEYVKWLDEIHAERAQNLQATLSEDMAFPELIEPGKILNRNKLASRFTGDKDFQEFLADYLNQNYLWRKTHNGSLDGFVPGRVVIDPDGNGWYWTKTGFRNVSKDKAYVSFRNTARAINASEVQDEFIKLLPNLPPATAIKYADEYLEFNRSAKRQLVKWIKRENQRAGKTVIDLDHITSLEEWEGTGADIFFNLQPLDSEINRSIGKKAREEWKDLNLALGSVKNIRQDIILWLDKFGPEGAKSGELWEFFREMSSEDRKILWNAVIVRRIPVNRALEQMKFGDKLFQLDLFDPDPKKIGNAGIWNSLTRFTQGD